MTTSQTPAPGPPLVTPVVDYEPPPVGMSACRATPVLRRRVARAGTRCEPSSARRGSQPAPVREADPPRTAVTFADAALRRVLEVIDRRRPVAQLRPLLAPALIDTVIELSRSSRGGAGRSQGMRTVARLCRMRLRMVDGAEGSQAEVFGTYTCGPRVRALAARIELTGERWRIVALQVG
ncbi:Rv3235 family protein [Mycobacterium neglectum]|uniref:Rv3235 family protein n=1 Tax=Mycobacterium neglectum TaxID=242737 RepID=UPI000BFEFF13|nr:Rv3235 family protein [Mycobacterium neglectum]